MTAAAILMLVISIIILWGGLIASIVALSHAQPVSDDEAFQQFSHRDL